MGPNIASTFERTLQEQGLLRALAFLNRTTPYRFTGVYRFAPGLVKSVLLYDRKNPDLRVGEDVVWNDSYCRITAEDGKSCWIEDSLADGRLLEHAARNSVQSYCGVLLRTRQGHPLGTLCHFDLKPRRMPAGTMEMLQKVCPAVERELWKTRRYVVAAQREVATKEDRVSCNGRLSPGAI